MVELKRRKVDAVELIRPEAFGASPARLFRTDPTAAAVAVLVASRRGVTVEQLLCQSRGRAQIAAARQLAMYLTHVMLGHTLTEVGTLYGRDRTTVAHACASIEDQREARAFEEEVSRLETEVAGFDRPPATQLEVRREAI